jgi:hypothetical protein
MALGQGDHSSSPLTGDSHLGFKFCVRHYFLKFALYPLHFYLKNIYVFGVHRVLAWLVIFILPPPTGLLQAASLLPNPTRMCCLWVPRPPTRPATVECCPHWRQARDINNLYWVPHLACAAHCHPTSTPFVRHSLEPSSPPCCPYQLPCPLSWG